MSSEDHQTILVVGDTSTPLSWRHVFEDAGYTVIMAGNGMDALAMAKAQLPAAVVSDASMPVMDGYALCHAIRHDGELRDTPVLLLDAASADSEGVIRSLAVGADGYLEPPLDALFVVSRVAALLALQAAASTPGGATIAADEADRAAMGAPVSPHTVHLLVTAQKNAQNRQQAAHTDKKRHLSVTRQVFGTGREPSLAPKRPFDLAGKIKSIMRREQYANEGQCKEAYLCALHLMALMLGLRDLNKHSHETRCSELAIAIAQEMGLAPDQVESLWASALIHDIGAMAVPADILNRTRALTKSEFALVKTHAQQGSDMLSVIDFPWPLAKIVLQHHERMDGSGYPAGLKGDAICIEARILAVADVVEAMCSQRPYRSAPGIAAALQELTQHRGMLYDATVVDACLRLFQAQGFHFTTEAAQRSSSPGMPMQVPAHTPLGEVGP